MKAYLVVKLKNGECKKYSWDFVDFILESEPSKIPLFIVYESESRTLVLVVPLDNVEYYERCVEEV